MENSLLEISGQYNGSWRHLHKNAASNIEKVQEAAPHKAAAVRPPTTHHKNYPSYMK